jgi:hypothetical protein
MVLHFVVPTEKIEKAKQRVRDVWNYREVDHVPISISLKMNPWGYTLEELRLDGHKHLRVEMETIKTLLETLPDDYVPTISAGSAGPGAYVFLAAAFGAKMDYRHGGDPNYRPTVDRNEPLIGELNRAYELKVPDVEKAGTLPSCLERVAYLAEETEYQIPISLCDASPVQDTFALFGFLNTFYKAMYKNPEALEHVLDIVTETIILLADKCVEAAGGISNVSSSAEDAGVWQPEGHKGLVADDTCASTCSPEFFNRFSKPFNNRIYRKYGGGRFHNCGPHPVLDEYLLHDPRIYSIDVRYRYSRNDLEHFGRALDHKAVIYVNLGPGPIQQQLLDYEHCMKTLAPNVVAIPNVAIDPGDNLHRVYDKFVEISTQYAKRMDWTS